MTNTGIDATALTQAAATFLQRGQADSAEGCAREALRGDPTHLGALNVLAVALNSQGKHARASEVFAELARRDPTYIDH